ADALGAGAAAARGSARGGGALGRSEAVERLPNLSYALLRPVRNARKGTAPLLSSSIWGRPVSISARRHTASAACDFALTSTSIWPLFDAEPKSCGSNGMMSAGGT